jgi:hypothetical protein
MNKKPYTSRPWQELLSEFFEIQENQKEDELTPRQTEILREVTAGIKRYQSDWFKHAEQRNAEAREKRAADDRQKENSNSSSTSRGPADREPSQSAREAGQPNEVHINRWNRERDDEYER